MVDFTKVIGRIIKWMEKGIFIGQMVGFMWVTTVAIKKMDMGCFIGQMVDGMKAYGWMASRYRFFLCDKIYVGGYWDFLL